MVLRGKKALKDIVVVPANSGMYTFCIKFTKYPKDCIWQWEDLAEFCLLPKQNVPQQNSFLLFSFGFKCSVFH